MEEKPLTPVERIKLLVEALQTFQAGLLKNATWAISATAIAFGWLATSNDARLFLGAHPALGAFFVVLIGLSTVGYGFLVRSVQKNAASVYAQLKDIKDAKGAFEHYRISIRFVAAYVTFQGFASAALIALILTVIA